MELKDKEILLSAMINIHSSEYYRRPSSGICHGIHMHLDLSGMYPNTIKEYMIYMSAMWQKWPEFSGNDKYPVRGVLFASDHAYHVSNNMWSKITPYGRRRWRLLRWLIAILEEEIHAEWGMRSSRVTNNIPE